MATAVNPQVHGIFDEATRTVTYVVHNGAGSVCAIIDSVLDYDAKSGRSGYQSADKVIAYIRQHDLQTAWILETHAHADHLSAAQYLQQQLGGKIAIGEHIGQVQQKFSEIFHLEAEFDTDGSQFDVLLSEARPFQIGELTAEVLFVPGHTPACVAYKVGDAVFVGDTLFMPDVGTARCDFPGGDAASLYRSLQKILALPAETRLFMCHDYPPSQRPVAWLSTVAEQKAHNIHVHDGVSEQDFIAMRSQRDATLAVPVLLLPSVQVNIRAGAMPPAEANGVSYLKIPVNLL